MEKLHFSVALVNSSIFSGNFLNFRRDDIIPTIVDKNIGAMDETGPIQPSHSVSLKVDFIVSRNAVNKDTIIIILL